MRAAFVGNQAGQPRVHRFRADKLTPAASGQELAQRRGLELLGVHSLTQQIDALLQDRAQARVAPGLDQRPGEGVLLVFSTCTATRSPGVTPRLRIRLAYCADSASTSAQVHTALRRGSSNT